MKTHSLSDQLIGSQLMHDSRVKQAKKLLHEAVAEYKQKITTIRPPLTPLKNSYTEIIEALNTYRGGNLWHPYIGSGFGNGALVELADGSVKYDFIGGIGVHYYGHNHPDLLDVGIDAALSNTVMQGHLQQNIDVLHVSELLVKASGLDHCFLTTSGVMANENAFKIAFQKNFPANRILAFEGCFVGRTIAISQITDKAVYREGIPQTLLVDYIPFYDPEHPEKSTALAVETLKKLLYRYPKQHAVMCFELVQGEGGFKVGEANFFESLMKIVKEHGIAVFADEVQTFGRTPQLFAYQYFGLQKYVDIASVGKVSHTCATLFNDAYKPRSGLLSQTFIASTSAIKTSYSIINNLLNDGFYGPNGKIEKTHQYFVEKLKEIESRHPDLIHGPWGIGAMVSFTPYHGDAKKVVDFVHRLFDAGLIAFIAGGGERPTCVRFLIPIGAITHRDIDKALEIVETVLTGKVE